MAFTEAFYVKLEVPNVACVCFIVVIAVVHLLTSQKMEGHHLLQQNL